MLGGLAADEDLAWSGFLLCCAALESVSGLVLSHEQLVLTEVAHDLSVSQSLLTSSENTNSPK